MSELRPQSVLSFNVDTDKLPANAVIAPVASDVPEPASLGLVAAGLLVTGVAVRRRRA